MALRTVTLNHRHLQQIALDVPSLSSCPTRHGESNYRQWSELDQLLVRLWESLDRPDGPVQHIAGEGSGRNARSCVQVVAGGDKQRDS